MSRRRKSRVFTEDVLLHIIRSKGGFNVNPLATRNRQKVKMLEHMRAKGVLTVTRFSVNNHLYTLIKV